MGETLHWGEPEQALMTAVRESGRIVSYLGMYKKHPDGHWTRKQSHLDDYRLLKSDIVGIDERVLDHKIYGTPLPDPNAAA